MAAKGDVGARHIDVASDHADFWTRGVGEAPEGPSGALSPRHSSGGFRHLLFSADERHDHEILNLADIERLDALRDQIRHRGIERRAFSYWGSVKGTVTLDVLRSPFFALSFAVYAATVAAFAHPAGIEDRTLYMTTLTVLGAFLSFVSVWKSKVHGTIVLNCCVDLHAIDAPPARWRGDAGSSPLDGASTAAPSPINDLVKNCRVHPTHWLISTGSRRSS